MGWIESWIKNRHDKALEHFDEALKYNPNNMTALMWKAITYQVTRKSEEAIALGLKAVELDPNNHVAYMILSQLLQFRFPIQKGRTSKKVGDIKTGLWHGTRKSFHALAMQEHKRAGNAKPHQKPRSLNHSRLEHGIFDFFYTITIFWIEKDSFQKAADYLKKRPEATNYD